MKNVTIEKDVVADLKQLRKARKAYEQLKAEHDLLTPAVAAAYGSPLCVLLCQDPPPAQAILAQYAVSVSMRHNRPNQFASHLDWGVGRN